MTMLQECKGCCVVSDVEGKRFAACPECGLPYGSRPRSALVTAKPVAPSITSKLRLALFAIFALIAADAMAKTIYRCETSTGTAYSDKPCKTDATDQQEIVSGDETLSWKRKSGETYVCKDHRGEWTEAACKPPEPPKPAAPAVAPKSVAPVSIGDEPKASAWDGVYYAVERHLKAAAHDPGSIKWEGCTKVIRSEIGWATRCDYRARNGFGALMKYKTLFIIRNDTVVAAENIQ